MNTLLFTLTMGLYIVGTAGYVVFIIVQKKNIHKIASKVLFCGFLLHTVNLVLRYIEAGYMPVTNLADSLSFFAWAIVGAYLFIQARYNIMVFGSFVSPVATLLMITSFILPKKVVQVSPVLKSLWITIHVGTSFIGNGAFVLAFCAGVMYLIQEHQIKNKKFGAFYRRLPSLNVLDELNYQCLLLGFPLLTVGILTGSIYAQYVWGSYWRWDPKETWSLITWLVYAAILHERLAVGWRGRRAAIMAIIGFMVLLFTFLGVNYILKGHHEFSRWIT